jgi:hypothetical protein
MVLNKQNLRVEEIVLLFYSTKKQHRRSELDLVKVKEGQKKTIGGMPCTGKLA